MIVVLMVQEAERQLNGVIHGDSDCDWETTSPLNYADSVYAYNH